MSTPLLVPPPKKASSPTLVAATPAIAQAVKPDFAQDSMNIFRRFPVEQRAAMVNFYQNALDMPALQPIQLSTNQQMLLFRAGRTGQIKLAAGITPGKAYNPGGAIGDYTGIRLFELHYPDEAAVAARFTAAGVDAPVFKTVGGKRIAIVRDPGGFNIALIITPGASPATTGGVEVGVHVTDLARSRAFYRDFAGLDELPPVQDPVLGTTKYPFRHGETTISLFTTAKKVPADTGSAGVQYVTRNVRAINDRAIAEKVKIDTPLGGVRGFNVLTVWMSDPDGVTNYFYETGPRPTGAGAPGGPPAGAGAPPSAQ